MKLSTPQTIVIVVVTGAALSCSALIAPWVLIAMGFALEDQAKERALRNYKPTSLADAVGYRYATPEMVAGFIDRGGDVNQNVPDWNGRPIPLVRSATVTGANVEVARLLIHRGARIGDAGLWRCALDGREAMARMLIEEGADLKPAPDADLEYFGSELIEAAAYGHQRWLIALLIQKGSDVRLRNASGKGLLHLAIWPENMSPEAAQESAETTKMLIAAGADVSAQDHDGATPLHLAASNEKLGEMRALLDAGAVVDTRDAKGVTALGLAAERCRPDSVALLLARGASRNAITTQGRPAAEGACYTGYPEINKPSLLKIRASLAAPSPSH